MEKKEVICLICEKWIEGKIIPYLDEPGPVPRSIPVCEACDEIIQSNPADYGKLKRDEESKNQDQRLLEVLFNNEFSRIKNGRILRGK